MGEWKDTPLHEVANLLPGYAFKGIDFGVGTSRGVKIKDVQAGVVAVESLDPLDVTSYNQERIKKYRLNAGDHLITMTGNLGRVATIPASPHAIYLNQRVAKLQPKANVVEDFLLYVIKSSDFIDYCITHADSETAQPNISAGTILEYQFSLPPESEQRAIASVLSSLDAKIDLLHRQNKTLEAMAETLFRQWFVEEAEEGWRWVQLTEHIRVHRGLSYTGAGLCGPDEGVPMHNLNSVYEGGGYKYDGIKYYKGEYRDRHIIKPGELIITNTEQGHDQLLIGCPAIIPRSLGEEGIFSQHVYRIEMLNPLFTGVFVKHLVLTSAVREQLTGATNGSTVNMLPADGIEMAKFQLPPDDKIKRFNEFALPLQAKQETNHEQIKKLIALRDTLLPKLMSGEVRVEEII